MATITGIDIQDMVRHWLNTPGGAYLGSGYGSNIKELLQRPQADGMADAVIQKMRADIPILQSLPAGSVNIYSMASTPDRLDLMIEVAGQMVEVPKIQPPPRSSTSIISDEFWLNASGELVAEGVFDYWESYLSMSRMTVRRGDNGEVLSYAPSLSIESVVIDWSGANVPEDPYIPVLMGGPTELDPTNNAWYFSTPFMRDGIVTVQAMGSRTSTVFSFSSSAYSNIGYEVIWA